MTFRVASTLFTGHVEGDVILGQGRSRRLGVQPSTASAVGDITGRVSDAFGAALPSVTVTLFINTP
jgi:hypothetical protein